MDSSSSSSSGGGVWLRRHTNGKPLLSPSGETLDPEDSRSSPATEETYEFEKIDLFILISIVMALAFEGSQQAKLERKKLAIGWVASAILELLLVIGYFATAIIAGGSKGTFRRAFLIMHAPVLLFILGLLIWNIVEDSH
jgi:hypothetical protein